MREYLSLFLQESSKQLAEIEAILTAAPEEGLADLDALFRLVHSFKGMAGTMGFASLAELTHRMEDLLGKRRTEEKPLMREEIALLLRAHDRMARLRGEIAEGGSSEADFTELLAALGNAHAPESPVALRRAAVAPPPAPGEDAVTAVVTLDPESPAPLARALVILQRFRQISPDLVCRPSEDEMASGALSGELTLALPGVTRGDVEGLYNALTDVAGLRFLEEAAPPPADEAPPETPAPAAPALSEGVFHDALHLPDTVEISTRLLDELLEIVGDLTIARARLSSLALEEKSDPLQEEARRLGALVRRLDDRVVSARLLPFSLILGRLRRFIREQSAALGKEVRLEVEGERIGLDKAVMLRLSAALLHLLRNALDHGLETPGERRAAGKPKVGGITISLARERNGLHLCVADDGRGIDTRAVLARALERGLTAGEEAWDWPEERIWELLFLPGFSTRSEAGELSGRGVGLDAVKAEIVRLGGGVSLLSRQGRGTEFHIRLPMSPAVAPVLLFEVGNVPLAFPVHAVDKTCETTLGEVRRGEDGAPFLPHGESLLPLNSLAQRLRLSGRPDPARLAVVALSVDGKASLWAVDRLIREEELFIKPFRGPWGKLKSLAGYSLLGDGRLVYLLDPAELAGE